MLKNVNSRVVKAFLKKILFSVLTSILVNEVCSFRKLDLFNSVIHVGIDGGQGSLKIIINVFDPTAIDFQPKNWKVNLNGQNWMTNLICRWKITKMSLIHACWVRNWMIKLSK